MKTLRLSLLALSFAIGLVQSSRATCDLIQPGQIVSGSVTNAQTNCYTFAATSNDLVYIALVRTNGEGNPYFYLFDPQTNLVREWSDGNGYSAHRDERLEKTGNYTLEVVEFDRDGSYDYCLSLTTLACGVNQRELGDSAEDLIFGRATSGSINKAADLDTFCFTAQSNDLIFAGLARASGEADAYVYLFDPDGNFAGGLHLGGGSSLYTSFALTNAGRYQFLVIAYDLAGTYDYSLSVTKMACGANQAEPGDGPEDLVFGRATSGSISQPADVDTFCFTAQSNDLVFAGLARTSENGEPYVYVIDPDGIVVGTLHARATPVAYTSFPLSKNGRYMFMLIDNGFVTSYDYNLSVTKVACGFNQGEPGDGAEDLVFGRITTGTINSATDVDTFCFTAEPNEVACAAIVRTNETETGEPYVYVFDRDGEFVGELFDRNGYSGYTELLLSKGGRYVLVVIDNSFLNRFDYTLCALKAPGPNIPELDEGPELLLPGERREGRLTAGDLDGYSFTAIAGDTISINFSRVSGAGEGIVQVYGPGGVMLGSGSSASTGPILIRCVENTGTYTLCCRETGLLDTFGYAFTLIETPGPPLGNDPDHPYLAIFHCENNIVVRWPTNATGFQLRFTDNLCPAQAGSDCLAIWTVISPPYWVIANHYYFTNQSAARERFYRLRR